jgi:DegV family protein with EDD domain
VQEKKEARMTVKIVTDSTCDLPKEVIDKYGITVIPIYVNFGENSFQDGVDLDRQKFYSKLDKTKTLPTTSTPPINQFINTYTSLAEKGTDEILSIHLASSIGGVYNMATLASNSIKQGFVKTFDAGQISFGTGIIVTAAAKLANAGKNLNEILLKIQDLANRTYTMAVVDNLNFLKHSGRVSQFKSLLGSILQVKPVLKFYKGIPTVEIVRTSKTAIQHLIRLLQSLGKLECVNILHIHAPYQAQSLLDATKDLVPELSRAKIIEVTPAIATHLGPGAVGFAAVVASPEK